MFPGVIGGAQRLPHRQRHQQFLRELLLAKGNRTAGHHYALTALVLTLGHLLDDAGKPAQRQPVLVLTRDHRAAKLHHQPTRVLQLISLGEGAPRRPLRRLQLAPQLFPYSLDLK